MIENYRRRSSTSGTDSSWSFISSWFWQLDSSEAMFKEKVLRIRGGVNPGPAFKSRVIVPSTPMSFNLQKNSRIYLEMDIPYETSIKIQFSCQLRTRVYFVARKHYHPNFHSYKYQVILEAEHDVEYVDDVIYLKQETGLWRYMIFTPGRGRMRLLVNFHILDQKVPNKHKKQREAIVFDFPAAHNQPLNDLPLENIQPFEPPPMLEINGNEGIIQELVVPEANVNGGNDDLAANIKALTEEIAEIRKALKSNKNEGWFNYIMSFFKR